MRLLIAIPALIVCLNLNAQKEKFFSSKWRDNSSASATPAPSDYTATKKGDFLYCLSNDDKNIYVDAKITESIEQNKVLQMGMTVWINTDGKSRKLTGIRYPIGAKYSKLQIKPGEVQESNISNLTSPLAQANTIELVGFKDIEVKKFPSNNTDNIRGFVKYDNDGNLIFSLTIPKSKLPAIGKKKDGSVIPMNLAIEYGAQPSTGGQSGGYEYTPPSPGGSRGGSRGGGGGGGRGGSSVSDAPGKGPSGPTNTQNEPQPVTIWMKDIKLADKK
jgi:hypothetical protein